MSRIDNKLKELELKTYQLTEQEESERLDDCIWSINRFIKIHYISRDHHPKVKELIEKQFQIIVNKALDN